MDKSPNGSSCDVVVYNTEKWIEENKQFFLPPVCNKMMHNGQMKVFYVGGPNVRKDYHLEEGEELFYMVKGDMCLKVLEHGKHKDIIIKEGEIFLLPGRVPHSPQRQESTVGLVIERERLKSELDGLRYYQEHDGVPTVQSLYEKWFYCEDLGTQLVPIIKEFFESTQYKTGIPKEGTIPKDPPITVDSEVTLKNPFSLKNWINKNRADLNSKGCMSLFGNGNQFQVMVYGKGENSGKHLVAETWIWQLEGTSTVTISGKTYELSVNDTVLIPICKMYTAKRCENSVALICFQDPGLKREI
ncbi:3-hydroxyanthranilate 3,4-dioxygenase isoform X1 [Patella vulgata]|uniref:3-hydroxyanthranilate 3,4-dioxygenase isoform X1 n=2 Tax=Patella vulgata TaxID=6465 RepID=UPI00217F944F|nr:3-hydroxyanthranilate 3,4-dioxygenase isoform X1 [Patella vulgata]